MYHDPDAFCDYWRNARRRTLRVLDAIPECDLEWSWAPGKFSFGDLFRHLAAIERYMFAENAMRRPSLYRGHSADLARGLVEVRAFADRCHREALDIFSSLSPADLETRCETPAGRPITVWKWLRSMVEHEAHHRGQLYMMASMRGLTVDPLYGLTEEQVAARSAQATPPGTRPHS